MWKTLSSKTIFTHPRVTLIEDEVLLPNGKVISYLRHGHAVNGGVTIIALRDDGKILVQKEYSYPVDANLFQFPGGGANKGESIEDAALRELKEEGKVGAKALEYLGSYYSNNRRSNGKMEVFLATKLYDEALPGDIEEEIESFWFHESEIDDMIRHGEIMNVNMLASWSLYKAKK